MSDAAFSQTNSQVKTILIVDDDEVVLKALSLLLQSQGYRVATATEGSTAIAAVREFGPDLLIMDVDFPPDVGHGGGTSWNGFHLANWLRTASGAGNAPVIVISGSDSAENKRRAEGIWATAFLPKPVDSKVLLQTIRNTFEAQANSGAATTACKEPAARPSRNYTSSEQPFRRATIHLGAL